MDTKTPPIPLKSQEKPRSKKTERVAEVFLPPLTPYPNYQPKNKSFGISSSQAPHCSVQHRDHCKKKLYRVLHIGATPLMHACQQGDRARVLRLLKEQEETIGYRDRTLRNALHYCMDAATGGAVAAVASELVNAPDAEGHTPLHLAVIAGDTQLVAVLMANGADVNAKDLEGHSVLHWATVCGEAECVRLVLAAGARSSTPDLRGGSPLHYAAQCCGAAATAELAVPKKVGLKVLQTLLEFGADVNAKDEDGRQPILWAASAGSVEAVLALARAGGAAAAGTSDKDGLTALHCAASRGHARCVEVLINLCGSQPDHVDDNGCSALHYAATLGHADATALILKLGADPNRQDRKGRTPALCAAAKGQLETLKILIQHGGSLHARSVRGTGIGHEAVASGRIELIRWLAKKKPSMLDVATHDGKTPLHVAALHGHLDACKILLDHGARINAVLRTSKGNSMTPLDAALYRGHRDCAKLIQMHGGTTMQQLRAHKTTPNKAKLRMKRNESSASDSSPCEERRIKSIHRKGNRKELDRRDSRSFSEEEVRLSSKKEERRARSVSARYDINGISSHNLHRKRNRRRSTRHKHEYLDSSIESDSCDYSHDDDGNETSMYRRAKRDKNRRSHETEAKSNARKEDDDDDRSVSDDSLEVIVVKSLEEKCKKVVSGRRSRIPEECTKETKLTKMHKCISKKISRSSKSRTSDNDEDMTVRGKSPSKEEKRVEIEKPEVHILRTSPEEEKDDNERIMESRYEKSMTDSTSQETVEQVVVTAMVHKDQMPDTPKSTLKMEKERTSFNGISRQKMTQGEETKEIPEYISSSGKPDKLKKQTVLEERVQQMTTRENSGTQTERKEETIEIIIPVAVEDTRDEKIDKTAEREVSLEEHSASATMLKRMSGSDEENVKLPDSENIKLDDDEEIATRKASPSDEESKISAVRQSDITASHETASSSKDNVDSSRVIREEKSRISTEPVKTTTPEKSESIKDLKEGEDLNKHDDDCRFSDKIQDDKKLRTQAIKPIEQLTDKKDTSDSTREKSADLSLTESKISMSKVNETFPLEKTRSSYDKKSGDTDRNDEKQLEIETGGKDFRYIDDSSSSSPKSSRPIKMRRSRSSTRGSARTRRSSATKATRKCLFESSEEHSPDRSAIVAVIDSPEWDEDEAVEKEIREALGEDAEHETEHEEDNEIGVVRVLPSTSEEEAPSTALGVSRTSRIDSLPQVQSTSGNRLVTIKGPEDHRERPWRKQRRDSGGRDSGIEPSPRVSRIPRRRNIKCCPNTAKQQTLNMETITRDVQVSLRRYHLERKIFFQLMELKRLQIRHGRANEHVLVKRQVDAFHKSGMIGPTLGVVKYDRPLTFRQFEAFLYEQLRRLQGRPTTPDFCTEAKQCTQKTHRCHHATSAYTSVPVYTYLGGNVPDQMDHLPKIESRGRGQMTVEVTHGEGKQVIALPAEKLDRTKKYFVTFTVRSETQDIDKSKSSCVLQRKTKSV